MIPTIIILAYWFIGFGMIGLAPPEIGRYPLWQLLIAASLWPIGIVCGVAILIKERGQP